LIASNKQKEHHNNGGEHWAYRNLISKHFSGIGAYISQPDPSWLRLRWTKPW